MESSPIFEMKAGLYTLTAATTSERLGIIAKRCLTMSVFTFLKRHQTPIKSKCVVWFGGLNTSYTGYQSRVTDRQPRQVGLSSAGCNDNQRFITLHLLISACTSFSQHFEDRNKRLFPTSSFFSLLGSRKIIHRAMGQHENKYKT